jgi:hypothetical protein
MRMGTSTTDRFRSIPGRTRTERSAHPAHRTMRRSPSRSGRSALHADRSRCPHRSSRGWVLRHRRRSRHTGPRIDSSCRATRIGTAAQRPEPGMSRGRAPTTPPRHRPQGASGSIDERSPSCPAALPRRPPLVRATQNSDTWGGRHLTRSPWFFYVGLSPRAGRTSGARPDDRRAAPSGRQFRWSGRGERDSNP